MHTVPCAVWNMKSNRIAPLWVWHKVNELAMYKCSTGPHCFQELILGGDFIRNGLVVLLSCVVNFSTVPDVILVLYTVGTPFFYMKEITFVPGSSEMFQDGTMVTM